MGQARRKNVLLENIIFLFILQGVNYILPLVTFPYLVRMLGMEKFGLLAFGMSFAQYFVLITDYGFNLTATQDISRCRNDIHEVSRIFCSVMAVKVMLMATCAVIYFLFVLTFDKFRINSSLYTIMFLAVVGNVLHPVWLFQGMETMKLLSIISCSVKTVITVMVFTLVRGPDDYLLTAFIQVSGVILSGIIAMFFVKYYFGIKLIMPEKRRIKSSTIKGWYVFISQVSVALFTNSNIFILGLFATSAIVGYFSIAEKIIRAVVGLTVPITTAVYPHISGLFQNTREIALSFLRKLFMGGSLLFSATSLLLFLFSDHLVLIISGSYNPNISILIKIMSILPISVFWDNIWGTQIMLNNGLSRQFMFIMIGAGAFSVASSLIFVPRFYALATATIFILTEVLILGAMIVFVRRKRIFLLRENVL